LRDHNTIFTYCHKPQGLFCGGVYCVVGQTAPPPDGSSYWGYSALKNLRVEASPYIRDLETAGDILVYNQFIPPDRINGVRDRIGDLISNVLRLLTWKYINNNKIRDPKVCQCTPYKPFDVDDIEYSRDYCPECKIMRAVAYLKRHDLINEFYKNAYPGCEVDTNYGVFNIQTARRFCDYPLHRDFYLRWVIRRHLPTMLIHDYNYVPKSVDLNRVYKKMNAPGYAKEVKINWENNSAENSIFLNRTNCGIPAWWEDIQDTYDPDPLNDYNYERHFKRAIHGEHEPEFMEWLDAMRSNMKPSSIPESFYV
jgi:hypothetical protein